MNKNKNLLRSIRRKVRIRKKLNNIKKHKLLVFRSSKHIYASILSEENDKTLCSYSSIKINKSDGQKKLDIAKIVGDKIAELAIEKGIKEVKFDKGPYKYHGRLKVLADAAREKGLLF
tara:strand:- start:2387 stop:2740 length:354 start_codon:yes stop_codon:yes gene_type:complete